VTLHVKSAKSVVNAVLVAMTEGARTETVQMLERYALMFRKEMECERAFVRAGGLLLAGPDEVICDGIAGFGDRREVELLVEAGASLRSKPSTLNDRKVSQRSGPHRVDNARQRGGHCEREGRSLKGYPRH
jgi:hypothetical protein